MIIEEDPAIREELTLLLENERYTPLAITEFTDVPGLATREHPDLILLDIGLPGKEGFSLCAALQKAIPTPVIFVTSRDAGANEVWALSLDEDDYIKKPHSVPVLLARSKAALGRQFALYYTMPAVPPVLPAAPFIFHMARLPEPGVMVGMSSPWAVAAVSLVIFFLIYAIYILLAYTSLKRNVLPK